MTASGTPHLRSTILATSVAVGGYIVVWLVTTQLPEVRARVPFGEDPYDVFASVAIVLLPLVGGLTAIRILRYGPSHIPAGAVSARIDLGLGICLAMVSVALASAIVALVLSPMEGPWIPLVIGLVIVLTIAAWILLARAVAAGMSAPTNTPAEPEPDAWDDVVALLARQSGRLVRIEALAEPIRRHRVLVGIAAALLAGLAAVVWHAIREGPWTSPAAAIVYGGILVAILLVAYGLLLGPLRVIRSA